MEIKEIYCKLDDMEIEEIYCKPDDFEWLLLAYSINDNLEGMKRIISNIKTYGMIEIGFIKESKLNSPYSDK
jgi:hypothetical protein